MTGRCRARVLPLVVPPLLLLFILTASWFRSTTCSFGPLVRPTKGEVWPKPQNQVKYNGFLVVDPRNFAFKTAGYTCDILTEATKRYLDILKKSVIIDDGVGDIDYLFSVNNVEVAGPLYNLQINLQAPCEYLPHLAMDEHYELDVNTPNDPMTATLTSTSIWGILRGLETFSQLLTSSRMRGYLMINSTAIKDYPRFPHRGLLLDTARHFQPLNIIYTILNGMEYNKMNVFHWHIVDDQSFPYQSQVFPDLSARGAYTYAYVYKPDDVQAVIDYARLRGIRVVPEFDTPGHTLSWGAGMPKLLTPCYTGSQPNGEYGPIDPTRKANYKFMKTFFQEVTKVFPDAYVHLGGDEVSFDCWASNPNINNYMAKHKIKTYEDLESLYIQQLFNTVSELNASSIVWQEVFQNGVKLHNDTVVHIWLGKKETLLDQVTSQGHRALLSECWYLDHLADEWPTYYKCDPRDFPGTDAQKDLVMGGEACMWGEMVDETNVVQRIFPRASAAAEKLWSSGSVNSTEEAATRLEEHVCRMRKRGIQAQPATGPGFCPLI